MAEQHAQLVSSATQYVQLELAHNDGSHDFAHVSRVVALAKSLAKEEGLSEGETRVAELAALLHDVKDWKYSGDAEAGVRAADELLTSRGCDASVVDAVKHVIRNVGFKDSLGGGPVNVTPALAVVQDADRLDAIGAIGIARCFAYGGSRATPLWDPSEGRADATAPPPTKEGYMKTNRTRSSVAHFGDKLLRLKSMLKTPSGRRRAEARHAFMELYLSQFYDEWEGRA